MRSSAKLMASSGALIFSRAGPGSESREASILRETSWQLPLRDRACLQEHSLDTFLVQSDFPYPAAGCATRNAGRTALRCSDQQPRHAKKIQHYC